MTQSSQDRQARLIEIRQQIAAGTYETPDKLELAVERLLQVIDDDPPLDDDAPRHRPRQPR